jgi:hypothetical protein
MLKTALLCPRTCFDVIDRKNHYMVGASPVDKAKAHPSAAKARILPGPERHTSASLGASAKQGRLLKPCPTQNRLMKPALINILIPMNDTTRTNCSEGDHERL